MRVFNLDLLDLVRYHGQSLLWDRALRGALSAAGPSLVGVALGDPELGLIATLCALWPWINDLGGDVKDRLVNMATSGDAILLGGLLAYFAGEDSGRSSSCCSFAPSPSAGCTTPAAPWRTLHAVCASASSSPRRCTSRARASSYPRSPATLANAHRLGRSSAAPAICRRDRRQRAQGPRAFLGPACRRSPGMIWQRWNGFAAITAMALVLLDMALLTQGGDRPLLSERIYDTALGCAVALLTTWVSFPSRWRRPPSTGN